MPMRHFRILVSAGASFMMPGLSRNSPSKSDGEANPRQGSMQMNGAPCGFDQIPSS
jgi:hypothetical protein